MPHDPKLIESLDRAWVGCWIHDYVPPDIERLPPRLWEPLRQRLQGIYRRATGEGMATLTIKDTDSNG